MAQGISVVSGVVIDIKQLDSIVVVDGGSYTVPAGFNAIVKPLNNEVRKEPSTTGKGHLFLGLTIDTEEAYPVLSFWCTDFDGGNLAGESYISLEASGELRWWCNSTAINFGRLNHTTNSDPLDVAPLQSTNSTADDQNEKFCLKSDVLYIPGSSNLNLDAQGIIKPNEQLPGEFRVPPGTVLDTGDSNGSAYNLRYMVELYAI